MAKATCAFFGSDSFGRSVEVAQSVAGVWYSREYAFNGYAMAWAKWAKLDKAPTYMTEGENKYTGEKYTIESGKVLNWGFSSLTKYDQTPKFRLPE